MLDRLRATPGAAKAAFALGLAALAVSAATRYSLRNCEGPDAASGAPGDGDVLERLSKEVKHTSGQYWRADDEEPR